MTRVAFIFATLILLACNKSHQLDEQTEFPAVVRFPSLNRPRQTNKIDTIRLMMAGTYEWVRTHSLAPGYDKLETPQTKGLTQRFVFMADGRVEYYENRIRKWANRYDIDYEFMVSTYPLDSNAMVIIRDTSGQRMQYFRPYLSNDSALFYNPYSSISDFRYFSRK